MIDLKQAVHECRSQILMDLDASDFRWPDVLMIRAANWTILEMLNLRPILKFSAPNAYSGAEAFLVPETALNDGASFEIQLPAKYREAFTHGMAARCFNGDANNQVDASRMAYELQRFNELMKL